ncbi:hypothetical protein VPZ82_21020 [Pseudomonas putida]|nr:hypothetical protein [Pseudomonas putida]WRW02171.1 hypothetical protein VPZ82_21020 [Pseudomonas putida]
MRNNQPITQRERTFPAQQRLISTTNAKGVVTYCNDAFIEISGFTCGFHGHLATHSMSI